MRLPASEVELFYKLHPALLLYVNQQLSLARHVTTIPQLLAMPEEERYGLDHMKVYTCGKKFLLTL